MKFKHFLSVSLMFFLVASGYSQEKPQVLFHLQSSDTLVHKSVVTQIANLKQEIPTASVVVVCNGPGVEFTLNKNNYINKLGKLNLSDVRVVACEFTLTQRKINKTQLSQFSGTVSHGIVEIVRKQNEKWLYIKTGF
jgi:intracellular sulfur oxidation DsrE/DsrF family protein